MPKLNSTSEKYIKRLPEYLQKLLKNIAEDFNFSSTELLDYLSFLRGHTSVSELFKKEELEDLIFAILFIVPRLQEVTSKRSFFRVLDIIFDSKDPFFILNVLLLEVGESNN